MAALLLLLLVIAGLVNVFQGNFTDAGILLGLSGVLGWALWLLFKEHEKSLEFLRWVQTNRQMIQQGWSYYNGKKITPRTVVTQYQACVSCLIFTTRFRSPRLVVGTDKSQGTAIIYTLISLLFGWWGFPWGLVYTPQAIYRNLNGGYRESIAELLPKVDAEIARLEKKTRRRSETAVAPAALSTSAK
ncbi:MAG TPA: hypothetical protein VLC12_03220 [Terriglobales bacterium]|nr:hypothetical protein [Terriglobales bacterium]